MCVQGGLQIALRCLKVRVEDNELQKCTTQGKRLIPVTALMHARSSAKVSDLSFFHVD